MDSSDSNFFTLVQRERSGFIKLIFLTIIGSLGINLVSNSFTSNNLPTNYALLIVGLVLILIMLIYLFSIFYGKRTRSKILIGVVVLKLSDKKLIGIAGYDFNFNILEYFNALFLENTAFKKLWDESLPKPLENRDKLEPNNFSIAISAIDGNKEREYNYDELPESQKLLIEATEFYLLKSLSTHLSDYFRKSQFKLDRIKIFKRNDIPDILLKNRFLELFSKQMEYRSTFTKTKSDEKVSSLRTKDGAIFEDFELTLPKGSTISRIEPNVIKIETKKFHIIFTINYQGMYVLDHLFTGFYLGDLDYLDLKPCRMEIKIDVNFKV